MRHLDYDDLVYGSDRLSELIVKFPQVKHGLTRYLYETILRRMEIRDKSRSVNSIDIVFNFDCIGFTGTPFLDNYPTASYIRSRRSDQIPDMIDRSFYAYTREALDDEAFSQRFATFQGRNSDVQVEYVSSDFMQGADDELALLADIFGRQSQRCASRGSAFNVLVDLCGLVKNATVREVRDLVASHFGAHTFSHVYHISPTDGGDRVLSLTDDSDVVFDEEFYNMMCNAHGAAMRDKIFFFVDNRNVIGKDVPFQLIYQRRFGQPLFTESAILAHDVGDFSKIWQAMGRSRTMNETRFTIYKSHIDGGGATAAAEGGLREMTIDEGTDESAANGGSGMRDIRCVFA